jgi:lipopolysaccharide/colanic/teichoic acid biosynthesis glycosyltransferase
MRFDGQLSDRAAAQRRRQSMSNLGRVVIGAVLFLIPLGARYIHQEFRAPSGTSESWLPYLLLGALAVLAAGLLESPPITSSTSRVFVNAASTGLLVLVAAATSQVIVPDSLPRFVMVLTGFCVFVWILLVGAFFAIRTRRRGGGTRVVAVINPKDAAQLEIDSAEGPWEERFNLIEIITDEQDFGSLSRVFTEGHANTLVLGPVASVNPVVVSQAEELHQAGARVRSLDDFYDQVLGRLPLSTLDRFALMGDIESLHGAYAPLKRALDLVLAFVGMIALIIALPFVVLGNLIANRGPLFFSQRRVGRHGSEFEILKFRSMSPGAVDISGWTSNDDPRITGFGRLLRRTHLDELPQVINIFRGELSVVGPRPEQVDYARKLAEALPFYNARHLVRPGLTGWAQVRYQYAASEEDAYVKLQFDLHYVRHESLVTDIRIIWLTVHHLLVDGGR